MFRLFKCVAVAGLACTLAAGLCTPAQAVTPSPVGPASVVLQILLNQLGAAGCNIHGDLADNIVPSGGYAQESMSMSFSLETRTGTPCDSAFGLKGPLTNNVSIEDCGYSGGACTSVDNTALNHAAVSQTVAYPFPPSTSARAVGYVFFFFNVYAADGSLAACAEDVWAVTAKAANSVTQVPCS